MIFDALGILALGEVAGVRNPSRLDAAGCATDSAGTICADGVGRAKND